MADGAPATERLRSGCLAYLRFGTEQPNRYAILFGSNVSEDRAAPKAIDTMTGAAAFSLLLEAVRACAPTGSDELEVAVAVWCGLHGYLVLKSSEPGFPWPAADRFLDTLLAGLVTE